MKLFWQKVLSELKQRRCVSVCLVGECSQGSPGTPGAQMLLTETGEHFGTIGGGNMEMAAVKHAAKRLREGDMQPELMRLVHRRDVEPGRQSGLICSGAQSNFFAVLSPERDLDSVETVLECLESGSPGILQMDETGLQVHLPGPNAHLEPLIEVWDTAGLCGFKCQLFNFKRIAIIGGGHCGAALARAISTVGFDVTVIDTRSVQLSNAAFTQVYRHQVADFSKAGAVITYPEWTDVIVMTPNYPSDVQALVGLSYHPYRSIGLMGSQAKLEAIERSLLEHGISKSWFASLDAPVGIPFNSDTPEEIAISVAASILQSRKPRKAKKKRLTTQTVRKPTSIRMVAPISRRPHISLESRRAVLP